MLKSQLFAAIVSMAAISVYAQVEVEDRALNSSLGTAAKAGGAVQPVNNAAELYYQMQVLQQEVLQLRGMVEEQANELKKLKQQRLDDYLELDRRLSKPAVATTESHLGTSLGAVGSTEIPAAAPEEELKAYRNAIDLVLKKQDYDKAIVELDTYLERYPKGRYAANAQYWLGEIYLLKNNLEMSRQWFAKLLADFPTHRKVPDAKFKLGKVYDMLGDKVTAKKLLKEVAESDSSAAQLAKEYLDIHFPS